MTTPTFLYIGAAKAGTSWLFEMLYDHPEVFVPVAKDLRFFEEYYHHGLDWYLSHFKGSEQYSVRGELSHDYFISELYAERIKQHLPDIKLIACLREPRDLMESAYNYTKLHDPAQTRDPEKYMTHSIAAEHIAYLRNLTWFYNRFPANNILIMLYDTLLENPEVFVKEVYDFLGVQSSYVPKGLDQRVNSARNARFTGFTQLAYQTAHIMRQIGFAQIVGFVKRQAWINKFLYTSTAEKESFPLHLKEKIFETYSPTYPDLEQLISKKLPSSWNKPSNR